MKLLVCLGLQKAPGSQDVLCCTAALASAAVAASASCCLLGVGGRLLNNFNIVAIMKALLFI